MKTLTRALFGALLALAAVTVLGAPAYAAGPVTMAAFQVAFTLDPLTIVQLLVAFVLPVLVGLVTTRVTSGARKAWLLAGLSLITSMLLELARALTAGTTYDAGIALLAALPAFVVSVATYYGLWKPTGIAAAAQDVGTVQVTGDDGAAPRMTRAQYRGYRQALADDAKG